MFGLFNQKPPLDPASSQWLRDHFAWALDNFGKELFFRHTVLVQPNNTFFPGRADSVQDMAQLVFDQVKKYAGVTHWPTELLHHEACALSQTGEVEIQGALRGPEGVVPVGADVVRLQIPYNPQQINNPEGLIASFAHTLGHYLGQMARTPPPAGSEYWPEITELLAIYLGFGLMFANSAFTFRGGCGSCYNPAANRQAALSETEATYALAIFAVLKRIPVAQVTPHLKKHLRGFFRRAYRDVQSHEHSLRQVTVTGEAG